MKIVDSTNNISMALNHQEQLSKPDKISLIQFQRVLMILEMVIMNLLRALSTRMRGRFIEHQLNKRSNLQYKNVAMCRKQLISMVARTNSSKRSLKYRRKSDIITSQLIRIMLLQYLVIVILASIKIRKDGARHLKSCIFNEEQQNLINLNYLLKVQQSMQNNCPICSRQYNQRSRKEMIICLKQHFICLSCADLISQKDSLCPFCRKKFDIKEIEPRRIFSEQVQIKKPIKRQSKQAVLGQTFCPFNHQSIKYCQEYKACQKCQRVGFIGGIQCLTCFYRECTKCLNGKSIHKQCDNAKLQFGEGEGFVAQHEDPTKRIVYGFTCNVCQHFTKKYIHCQACNLYACPNCRQFACKK